MAPTADRIGRAASRGKHPPDMPIQIGPLSETLERANVTMAKSVVVVTDDEVANLEVSLMIRSFNPHLPWFFGLPTNNLQKISHL